MSLPGRRRPMRPMPARSRPRNGCCGGTDHRRCRSVAEYGAGQSDRRDSDGKQRDNRLMSLESMPERRFPRSSRLPRRTVHRSRPLCDHRSRPPRCTARNRRCGRARPRADAVRTGQDSYTFNLATFRGEQAVGASVAHCPHRITPSLTVRSPMQEPEYGGARRHRRRILI